MTNEAIAYAASHNTSAANLKSIERQVGLLVSSSCISSLCPVNRDSVWCHSPLSCALCLQLSSRPDDREHHSGVVCQTMVVPRHSDTLMHCNTVCSGGSLR